MIPLLFLVPGRKSFHGPRYRLSEHVDLGDWKFIERQEIKKVLTARPAPFRDLVLKVISLQLRSSALQQLHSQRRSLSHNRHRQRHNRRKGGSSCRGTFHAFGYPIPSSRHLHTDRMSSKGLGFPCKLFCEP